MLDTSFNDSVNEMIESLEYEAENSGVSLEGITSDNFNSFLDDLFNDGGYVRCEKFTDLAWDYADQFGCFGSDEWETARWEVIEEALRILEERYN